MGRALQEAEVKEVIREMINALEEVLEIELVIFFGSYVENKADEWSDIDLAVISPNFQGMSLKKRIRLLSKFSYINDVEVQIHDYTPKDLAEARPTNFLGHILKIGKIVYKDGMFLI